MVTIIVNCLVLDVALITLCCFYLVKMCPLLKQKIALFKNSKIRNEEDQVSASTPSTIKKENILVDNVGFETE